MYSISSRFQEAMSQSAVVTTTADVRLGGVLVATDLLVVGGNIKSSKYADIRSTCNCEVVGVPTELLPNINRSSPLDPYGNEIYLKSGVTYHDGTSELIPQGVFRITDSNIVDTSGGIGVKITGSDRSSTLSFPQLVSWNTATGVGMIDAITAFVLDRMPTVTIVEAAVNNDVTTTTHILEEKGSGWKDLVLHFAAAAGAEAYFDREGQLFITDAPDPYSQPVVWRFEEGAESTLLEVDQNHTDRGGYNAVVIESTSTAQDPVRAQALDLDPNSRTYVYGPYGLRPLFETTAVVSTQAQCQRMADTRLAQLTGATEEVNITVVPHYAIDPGDVIQITRERSGIDDIFIVNSLSLPLTHRGTMSLECRVRRQVVDA